MTLRLTLSRDEMALNMQSYILGLDLSGWIHWPLVSVHVSVLTTQCSYPWNRADGGAHSVQHHIGGGLSVLGGQYCWGALVSRRHQDDGWYLLWRIHVLRIPINQKAS